MARLHGITQYIKGKEVEPETYQKTAESEEGHPPVMHQPASSNALRLLQLAVTIDGNISKRKEISYNCTLNQ
jgi:hypothetical protein